MSCAPTWFKANCTNARTTNNTCIYHTTSNTVKTWPRGLRNKNKARSGAKEPRFILISNCTTLAAHPMQAQEHWRVPLHDDVTLWLSLHVTQEEMCSCDTRRNVFLWHKKNTLLVTQDKMLSYVTRRHFFWCHKKTCLLVTREEMYSFVTGGYFLCHEKVFILPSQDISSCVTRRQPFSCHKNICLLVTQTTKCLLVTQEDMCSCDTRRNAVLWPKNKCLLGTQAEISSCDTRRTVFLWHENKCLLDARKNAHLSFQNWQAS